MTRPDTQSESISDGNAPGASRAAGEGAAAARRIDAPHTLPPPSTAGESGGLAAPSDPPETLAARARELDQLAELLHERHRELCARQESLNAQQALWEKEQRKARLQLESRREALDERDNVLAEKEARWRERESAWLREVSAREAELEQASSDLAEQQAAAAESEDHLRRASERLRERETELESKREQVLQREEELSARSRTLQQRELELQREADSLARLREDWTARQEEAERRWKARRQRSVARWKARRSELQRLEQEQRQRARELDQQQTGLHQMREELQRLHAQVIEHRIAVESAFEQLGEVCPDPQRTQLVAQLHRQLAEEYRLWVESREEQRRELVELAARVHEQASRVRAERKRLVEWHRRRELDLERQAARLIARERELEQHRAVQQDQIDSLTSEVLELKQRLLVTRRAAA